MPGRPAHAHMQAGTGGCAGVVAVTRYGSSGWGRAVNTCVLSMTSLIMVVVPYLTVTLQWRPYCEPHNTTSSTRGAYGWQQLSQLSFMPRVPEGGIDTGACLQNTDSDIYQGIYTGSTCSPCDYVAH